MPARSCTYQGGLFSFLIKSILVLGVDQVTFMFSSIGIHELDGFPSLLGLPMHDET